MCFTIVDLILRFKAIENYIVENFEIEKGGSS